MTNEEAIEILEAVKFMLDNKDYSDRVEEAINMAIDALHENESLAKTVIEASELLRKKRPQGEWEFIGNNLFKCTHCGYIADADYLRKWRVYTFDPEFPTACLKCGADMRREGEAE